MQELIKKFMSNAFKNKQDLLQKYDEMIAEQVALKIIEPIADYNIEKLTIHHIAQILRMTVKVQKSEWY